MDLIKRSFGELLSIRGYFGLVGLSLLFGVSLILPKRIVNFKWGILWMLAVINLGLVRVRIRQLAALCLRGISHLVLIYGAYFRRSGG